MQKVASLADQAEVLLGQAVGTLQRVAFREHLHYFLLFYTII